MKRIYSINIPGENGYSFAVKCEGTCDEAGAINLALQNHLFEDDREANYAMVEDITNSEYDINGLKNVTYEL